MKDTLERRMGVPLPPTAAVLQWMVLHAAGTLNRHAIGTDDKMRCRGPAGPWLCRTRLGSRRRSSTGRSGMRGAGTNSIVGGSTGSSWVGLAARSNEAIVGGGGGTRSAPGKWVASPARGRRTTSS